MKRSERISYITKTLVDHPNKIFSLRYFSEQCGASKSSVSEDIDILRKSFQKLELGNIETIVGASGGVRFRPELSDGMIRDSLLDILEKLREPRREILGEYIFYGDILYQPDTLQDIAMAMHKLFADKKIDGVMTIETKGVPIAIALSRLLNVPTIVARKTNRVSEGNTISVHYKSNTKNTVQSMYVTKGAIPKGAQILIVDDYMKAGGTIIGMKSLIHENEAHCVGSCVFMQEGGTSVTMEQHAYLFRLDKINNMMNINISEMIFPHENTLK